MALRELQLRNVPWRPWSECVLLDAFLAANKGDISALKTLAKSFKADEMDSGSHSLIYSRDKRGSTVLHAAVAAAQIRVVDYLLRLGASANCTDNLGQSAMHVACSQGDVAVIKRLVQSGGSLVSPKDGAGRRPFDCAVSSHLVTSELAKVVEEHVGVSLDCSPPRRTQQARLLAFSASNGLSTKGDYLTITKTKMGRYRPITEDDDETATKQVWAASTADSRLSSSKQSSTAGSENEVRQNEERARRSVKFSDIGKENDVEPEQQRGIRQLVRSFSNFRRGIPLTQRLTGLPMASGQGPVSWESSRRAKSAPLAQGGEEETASELRPGTPPQRGAEKSSFITNYTSPLVPLPSALACRDDVDLFGGKLRFDAHSPPEQGVWSSCPKTVRFEASLPRATPQKDILQLKKNRSLSPIHEEKDMSLKRRKADTSEIDFEEDPYLKRQLFTSEEETATGQSQCEVEWYLDSDSTEQEAMGKPDEDNFLDDLIEGQHMNTLDAGSTPGIKPSRACMDLHQLVNETLSSANFYSTVLEPFDQEASSVHGLNIPESVESKPASSVNLQKDNNDDSGHSEPVLSECSSVASLDLVLPDDMENSGCDDSLIRSLSNSRQDLLSTRISTVDVDRMFNGSPLTSTPGGANAFGQ